MRANGSKLEAECERAVVLATQPAVQAIYRDLARQWHEMAEQSEDLERRHEAWQRGASWARTDPEGGSLLSLR
jgi:hypothetical protein